MWNHLPIYMIRYQWYIDNQSDPLTRKEKQQIKKHVKKILG